MSALLAILPESALLGQDDKTNTSPSTFASTTQKTDTRNVTVGAFTVKLPNDWQSYNANDTAILRSQFIAKSEAIYQQYTGSDDLTKVVDVVAFNMPNDAGSFLFFSFTVPPQLDLINILKSEAAEKGAWGVREGYIRKYLGLVPVDDERFSGFYIKVINKNGSLGISGGLEHKKLKNTLIQLSMSCSTAWDEAKAINTFLSVLKSMKLGEK